MIGVYSVLNKVEQAKGCAYTECDYADDYSD